MRFFEYIITNNNTLVPEVKTLVNNPKGWEDKTLTFKRSDIYFSVNNNFSFGFEFVGDGKIMVDNIKENYGIEAKAAITINKRHPQTLAFEHFYTGILDFSTYEANEANASTTIATLENDKLAKFRSRDEMKLNLYDVVSVDNITIDSFVSSPQSLNVNPIYPALWAYYDFDTLENKGNNICSPSGSPFILYTTGDLVDNVLGSSVNASPLDGKIYTNNTGATREVSLKNIKAVVALSGVMVNVAPPYDTPVGIIFQFNLGHYNSSNVLQHQKQLDYYINSTFTSPVISPKEFSHSDTIDTELTRTMANGDYIKLHVSILWSTLYDDDTNLGVGSYYNLSIVLAENWQIEEEDNSGTASINDVFFIQDAAARLLQLMTSELDTSKLLNAPIWGTGISEFRTYTRLGEFAYIGVCSAKMIRNFPTAERTCYVSFKELFQSADSFQNIGCWYDSVNDYFYINEKEQFFKDTEILNIGEVKDLIIKNADEQTYNKILSGCANDGDYESINGILEFNNKTEYTNIITRKKNDIELQSKLRTDSLGVELTRREQYDFSSSEDTKADNDTFLISCKKDGSDFYNKNGSDFYEVGGMPNIESFYNFEMMPKAQLLQNGAMLRSVLYKNLTSNIKILNSTSSRNIYYQVSSTSDKIYKNNDVTASDLAVPYYFPNMYEFTAPVDGDIIEQLQTDPHGYIEFSYLGVTYYGYVMEVSTEPYKRKGNWLLIQANKGR